MAKEITYQEEYQIKNYLKSSSMRLQNLAEKEFNGNSEEIRYYIFKEIEHLEWLALHIKEL